MTMRSGISSRVLGALLAGSLAVAGVASCAAFPAGPAPVAEAGTASLTVRPSFDGFGVQSTDVAKFDPAHVTKLVLELYTVASNVETAVRTAAGAHVTVTRTSGYTAPVTFDHLRYGNTYRIRAVAYRTVGSAYEAISTTDSGSYVDVVVTADTASLNQTHALKVKLADRGLSARRLGTPVTVSTAAATTSRSAPAIAYNPDDNQYLVVWVDGANSGDLVGQRLSATGAPLSTQFAIATAAGPQDQPAVAYSPALRQYYVVWRDRASYKSAVHGQFVSRVHVDGQSELVGSNTPLISDGSNNLSAPSVAAQQNPAYAGAPFLVSWYDDRNLLLQGRVNHVPVLSTGTSAAQPSLGTANVGIDFHSPALAHAGATGQYLQTYAAYPSGILTTGGIVAQALTATGARVWPSVELSSTTNSHVAPAAAYNPAANEHLVAWQDESVNGGAIVARRVTFAQTPTLGATLNVSDRVARQARPAVVFNTTTGEYLVAWADQRTNPASIYAQRLTAAGVPIGTNFSLGFGASLDVRPAIAYNATTNQAYYAWQAPGTVGTDVVGQLLDYFARAVQPSEVTPQ